MDILYIIAIIFSSSIALFSLWLLVGLILEALEGSNLTKIGRGTYKVLKFIYLLPIKIFLKDVEF